MLERKVHAAFWFHEPSELAVLQSRLAVRRRCDQVARELSLGILSRTNDCIRPVLRRSAWLYRSVISFALVGAESWSCLQDCSFGIRGWTHVLSLPLTVGVLLVLPRPHVRWPLAGRAGIMCW